MDKIIEQLETSWTMDISKREYSGVPPDVLFIFNRARLLLNTDPGSALECCEATLQSVWELLNVGRWDSVPLSHQQIYSDASYYKCLLLLRHSLDQSTLKTALKACDMGLLLGAGQTDLHEVANVLNSLLKEEGCDEVATKAPYLETEEQLAPAEPIPSLNCPSLETFYKNHFCHQQPTVLTNCIEHWPARTKWNPNYLKQVAGGRTVPIELGSHYADDDWGQRLMTIAEFVDEHMLQSSKSKGYLAQHLLFDQVPDLKKDIYEPDYCCLQHPNVEDTQDESKVTEINAWFGPAGTVSPLHYDSKHNIFAQVYGYKRVWLFKPEDSAFLYPHESPLLFNTARTDPENLDHTKFPDYAKASAFRCVLRPGDCLYIPPRWWHHVRALTASMSVSFWWT